MARLHVLYHGCCFDGCASAALFSSFYGGHVAPDAEVTYGALTHGPPGPLPESVFLGDDNAIVDFGYNRSDRLTWWFDHHQSGLEPPDEAHLAGRPEARFFYDPKASSCAGFIARSLSGRYGFDTGAHAELLEWADIIDSASFEDARTAVELQHPALRIMTVLEAAASEPLQQKIIKGMQVSSLREIVDEPEVAAALAVLLERHQRLIGIIRERATLDSGVVTFDITDLEHEAYNKFIPYYLHPEAVYVVAVSSGRRRAKVSVGFNPWRPKERRHNIAEICQRFGGGGHPVVGAISLPPDQVAEARRVAEKVAEELRGS